MLDLYNNSYNEGYYAACIDDHRGNPYDYGYMEHDMWYLGYLAGSGDDIVVRFWRAFYRIFR